jgi:hypothetical protein
MKFQRMARFRGTRILEVADHDELIYKLTLKYLRQDGFDIGNNIMPRVKPLNIG